ncbi:MAG: hypothetical protein JSS49_21280 [Planctomycetes bacterium]|nr:hypothetical protein [Planctomycetota bacterium]
MKCPRCKCGDVYVSHCGREKHGILSLITTAVRCHFCSYQFSVPRWTQVPKKSAQDDERRAA